MKIEPHTITVRDLVAGYVNSEEEGVVAYGGKTVPENLQMLCRRCNGLKSDR